MAQPLTIERTINASTPRVWRALTDPKELKQWLPFMSGFKPEVNHELHFRLGKDPKHEYWTTSKVIEVIPDKKLTYSWNYDGYSGSSQVTFELFPEGGQTRLKLTHQILEPFPADNPDFAADGFREGWNFTADSLKKFSEQ